MGENETAELSMTKDQASSRYARLAAQAGWIINEYTFYETYFSTARNILEAFPISTSQSSTAAVLPNGA